MRETSRTPCLPWRAGEAKDFQIKDVRKLNRVAGYLGINVEGKSVNEVAEKVALKFLEQFGQQRGELAYLSRAPKKRQEIWKKLGIAPRAIDREVVEMMHRTTMGVDQEVNNIMLGAMRASLADGWGGSMMGTDISDILFGTPMPIKTKAGLDVFKEDHVNLVVHGHEPSFAEMLVVATEDPEIMAYAKTKGAKGVNLVGMCCTANEILVRHGIATAGGFLQQELGLITGMVEAMVVDVQCIMPAISQLSKRYHTKIITTTPKGKMYDAVHIEYDEHHGLDIAKKVVRLAIDNFPNRKKEEVAHCQRQVGRCDRRVFRRVYRIHAGRPVPGFLPAVERRHHRRPYPRRRGPGGLQQPEDHPGQPA